MDSLVSAEWLAAHQPGRDTTNATDEISPTGGEPAVVDVAPKRTGCRAAICLVLATPPQRRPR